LAAAAATKHRLVHKDSPTVVRRVNWLAGNPEVLLFA
jgi:hypothetical protein